MLTVLFLVLVLLCFLYDLNLYLRGGLRGLLEKVFVFLIFAVLAATFFAGSWKGGVLAVVLVFPLCWVMMPLARALARPLVGHRTGIAPAQASPDPADLLARGGIEALMEHSQREREAASRRLEKLSARPAIRTVLERHDVSLEEYRELHEMLSCTLLAELTWEILSEGNDLEKVLLMYRDGKTPGEIWSEIAL